MALFRKSPPEYLALVVENERDFRADLVYTVETLDIGISVRAEASSFEDALEQLHNAKFDLLITDINLTDEARFTVGVRDGIELARYAREHCNIPTIFLTAFANDDPDVVSQATACDPITFIQKQTGGIGSQTRDMICLALRRMELIRRERETARQLQAVIGHIGKALLYIDSVGHIFDFNDGASALLEQPGEALIDQYWEDVIRIETFSGIDLHTLRTLIASRQSARLPAVAIKLLSGRSLLSSLYAAPAEHHRERCMLFVLQDLQDDVDQMAAIEIEPGDTLALVGLTMRSDEVGFDPVQHRLIMQELQAAILTRTGSEDSVNRSVSNSIGVVLRASDEVNSLWRINALIAQLHAQLIKRYPAMHLYAGLASRSAQRSLNATVAGALDALDQAQQQPINTVYCAGSSPVVRELLGGAVQNHQGDPSTRMNVDPSERALGTPSAGVNPSPDLGSSSAVNTGNADPGYNCYALRDKLRVLAAVSLLIQTDTPVALVGETGTLREDLAKQALLVNASASTAKFLTVQSGDWQAPGSEVRFEQLLQGSANALLLFKNPQQLPAALQAVLGEAMQTRRCETGTTKVALPAQRFAVTLPRPPAALAREGAMDERLASALDAGVVIVDPLGSDPAECLQWAERFLQAESTLAPGPSRRFDEGALRAIEGHNWHGNLREMKDRVHQGVQRSLGASLSSRDLGLFRFLPVESAAEPSALANRRHGNPTMPDLLRSGIAEVIARMTASEQPPSVYCWLEDELVEAALERHREDRDPVLRTKELLGMDLAAVQDIVGRSGYSAAERQANHYWQNVRLGIRSWIYSAAGSGDCVEQRMRGIILAGLAARAPALPSAQAAFIAGCSLADYRVGIKAYLDQP
ncbi:MAG: DNA-binding NtrC family response regulator [Halieaceae bacterium]|jgi:DNA-binding NtrC family response regulator